jgi:hypothetical protein
MQQTNDLLASYGDLLDQGKQCSLRLHLDESSTCVSIRMENSVLLTVQTFQYCDFIRSILLLLSGKCESLTLTISHDTSQNTPTVETVIFDSMTMFASMALHEAVAANKSGRNKISIEQPGISAYAYRNALVLGTATTMLAVTAKCNRNIIFTTHEGSPDTDEDGHVQSITMILSTNLANQIGLRINEVWHLRDTDGKQRTISVRPHSRYTPMKTRLFDADKPQFPWHFDANTLLGEGIADWWDAWKNNGGKKIALPLSGKATTTKGAQKRTPTQATV